MCLTILTFDYYCACFCYFMEMMGLIGAGNNPMVGMTVAVAVAVEEAMNK